LDLKLKKAYVEKNKEKETEVKLNSHSVFKHLIGGEVKLKDVSVVFIRGKDKLDVYRTIVGTGEAEKRRVFTNQVSSEGISVNEQEGYKLELFIEGKLIEAKNLE
jgi:hypothetical protein